MNALDDKTLQLEGEGYRAYMEKVCYRLNPGELVSSD